MPTALVTGSGGLIGSQSARQLVAGGFDVIGVDNDMRASFFGPTASTDHVSRQLVAELGGSFRWHEIDIRDVDSIDSLLRRHAKDLELLIHTAAQPSHDWAASAPAVDFSVNATGTLNLLEAARAHAPDATFVFCSTNKVYGDRPNQLPLTDVGTRFELPTEHPFHRGIDTSMSIDSTLHSLFGVSKAAADLMVQEYGRYFGMPTVCFRGGCLTGPNHAGAQLHGFLAYLMRCTVAGTSYRVLGYEGKQVRDNIHARDVVEAFLAFHAAPRPAAVYNLGGGRGSNCSMLEAIAMCEKVAGRRLNWTYEPDARTGDHQWWVSDLTEFQRDYPAWRLSADVDDILREMYEHNAERWSQPAAADMR